MSTVDLEELQARIIDAVHTIRAEHHACSVRTVAALVGIPHATAQRRIADMVDDGLLTQTEMHGSLRVADEAQ